VPRWFIDELRTIDPDLHLVWHEWQVTYDDFMTQYSGDLDDPRFTIHEEHGQEIWGWILTDGENTPLPDGSWHIWRLCDVGWAHVTKLDSRSNPQYLRHILKRLHLQAVLSLKGRREYRKLLEEEQEAQMEKSQRDAAQLFDDVQTENKKLMDTVKENFEWGRVKPTRPKKETITSYRGQTNRSRMVRDLDDEEGGLIIPESWK
jgi:hypothetical protein